MNWFLIFIAEKSQAKSKFVWNKNCIQFDFSWTSNSVQYSRISSPTFHAIFSSLFSFHPFSFSGLNGLLFQDLTLWLKKFQCFISARVSSSDGLLRKSLSMLSVMSSVHAITSNVLFFDSFGFLSTCSDLEWSNPLLNAFAKLFSQFTVWRVQMINTDQKIKLDLISKLKAVHFKSDSTGSV